MIDPQYWIDNYGYCFNAETQQVTLIDCYQYQRDAIEMFEENQNSIVLKSRQCLPADTFVDTPEGPKAIQDFKIGDEVYSYNLKTNQVETDIIYDAWESGERQCVKFKLKDNRSFEVGENHPFWIKNKQSWVKAKDFKEGDEILFVSDITNNIAESAIVTEIEKTSIKICYDISVTKNENFLINGLLTHNTGFSVISAAYIAWTVLFKSDQRILILANDLASAVRLLKTVKDFISNTPKFLLPDSQVTSNEKRIEFSNGSWVRAVACSPQAGRGESLTLLVVDEVAFIENGDDIKAGALMATSKTGGKTIMISTPNGTGNLYHQFWTSSLKGENNYKRLIAHWTQNPTCIAGLEKRIDKETGRLYDWSIWYQEQCERLGWDKVKIAQELDLSFESSKYLAIDSEIISKYKDDVKNSKIFCYFDYTQYSLQKPCFTQYESQFWIYELPVEGRSYIIACDVAGGAGKDYSTIQILDAVSLIQVAEFQGKITADKFADVILTAEKAYNNAFVTVEVNNMGLTTAYYLHKTLGYKNVYKSQSIEEVWTGPKDARWKAEIGDEIPGFQTNSKTRPFLITTLLTYMREKQVKINSPRLLAEFDTFVIKANGKAEHERGGNDDLIIAFAIALFIRDTQWEKVAKGKAMFKSMLENMASTQTTFSGTYSQNDEILRKKAENTEIKNSPLFIFGSESEEAKKEDDDINWLYS
jgi:hypothetical protein